MADRKGIQESGPPIPPTVKKRKPAAQSASAKAKTQSSAVTNSTVPTSATNASASVVMLGIDNGEEYDTSKKASHRKKLTKEEEDGAQDAAGNGRARPARSRGGNVRESGSDGEEDESEVDSNAGGGALARSARVSRVARPGHQDIESNTLMAPVVTAEDTDERRYCFCNNVSYGDMIGCDDDDCEREWVSCAKKSRLCAAA
jgi:inhibitor of growth protein 3